MTRQTLFLAVFLLITLVSCNNPTTQNETAYVPFDTSNSFRINNYWVTPKKSFDFNSLGKSSRDTLHLITCSNYVYFPFGKLTDKSSLKSSLLKDFYITSSHLDTFVNSMLPSNPSDNFKQWSETLELELGENKLSLFLDNDPEASMHGYIRSGKIVDSKILFSENIRIGMSSTDFYNLFFDYFPKELTLKYPLCI
jgi:hypothetical protein